MDTNETTSFPDGFEPLWTLRELMKYLRCSRTQVWRLVRQHGLPCYQFGGEHTQMKFRPEEVRTWVKQHDIPHWDLEQEEDEPCQSAS